MQNNVLKRLYLRIQVSKYLSRLQELDERYTGHNNENYRAEKEKLISEVLALCNDPSFHPVFKDIRTPENLPAGLYHFLEALYNATRPISRRQRKVFTAAIVFLLLIIVVRAYPVLKMQYHTEKEQADLNINEKKYTQQTLQDILALKDALQKYFSENQSYPKSSGGWDGKKSPYGESKEVWIPGLAPKYISPLPSDPRNSVDAAKQYLYRSDGTNYKVIAHKGLGIDDIIKQHPELIDPERPTWAFGVWTEGAKNW